MIEAAWTPIVTNSIAITMWYRCHVIRRERNQNERKNIIILKLISNVDVSSLVAQLLGFDRFIRTTVGELVKQRLEKGGQQRLEEMDEYDLRKEDN